MKEIFLKTEDYLKLHLSAFAKTTLGKISTITCPFCNCDFPSMNIIPYSTDYWCRNCHKRANLLDFVRLLEKDKSEFSDDDILKYIGTLFNIHVVTNKDRLDILDYYYQQGFDLVPIQRNGKIPIEKEWPTKNHRDLKEWKEWLNQDLNIGCKTGKISNVTVIDIDNKNIPGEISKYFIKYEGLVQETSRGWHYFFQYEADLPKASFNYIVDINDKTKDIHIDIENDGGQVVLFPSIVNNIERKILDQNNIPKMSEELKEFLKSNIKQNNSIKNDVIPLIESNEPDLKLINNNLTGCCNNTFIKLGGILRKELNLDQTSFVLHVLNRQLLEHPMPSIAINGMVNQLNKYINFDDNELAQKILNYLRMVGDATARDVKEVVNESKEKIDKALSLLLKEGYITKARRMYQIIRKADWKENLVSANTYVNFKVPYFYDIAHFSPGDMLLLSGKTKSGKTHISMNIVKQLVDQGIKPYYFSLESGSRFARTALALGLKEGDFYWTLESDPTKIEFEKNAVTIIDWLFIEDFAQTNVTLKYFVDQLFKTNGFLIVFAQLKTNGEWFAPNLITNFPALAARYLYDDEKDGTYGKWKIDAIRDPKEKVKTHEISCIYNWDTKELKRLDEIKNGDEK